MGKQCARSQEVPITGLSQPPAGCLCLQAQKTLWLLLPWALKPLHLKSQNSSNAKIKVGEELLIIEVRSQESLGANPSTATSQMLALGELGNILEPLFSHVENGTVLGITMMATYFTGLL